MKYELELKAVKYYPSMSEETPHYVILNTLTFDVALEIFWEVA